MLLMPWYNNDIHSPTHPPSPSLSISLNFSQLQTSNGSANRRKVPPPFSLTGRLSISGLQFLSPSAELSDRCASQNLVGFCAKPSSRRAIGLGKTSSIRTIKGKDSVARDPDELHATITFPHKTLFPPLPTIIPSLFAELRASWEAETNAWTMAATNAQTRWRLPTDKLNFNTNRITRSARELGRSAFHVAVDPDRDRVMLLRGSVSPHWKRVSSTQQHSRSIPATRSLLEDDVKAQRRALLVSDFRYVSKSRAQRSAQLEREFEKFASEFGASKKEEFVGFADFVGEGSSNSRRRSSETRKRTRRSRSVRFAQEEEQQQQTTQPQQSWDIGFREEMQNGFQDMDSDVPLYGQSNWRQPKMVVPLRQQAGSSLVDPYGICHNIGARTDMWTETGDSNSLYNGTVQDTITASPNHDDIHMTEINNESMHTASAVFINDLAIPDAETKQKAIVRLKTVERHLQEPILSLHNPSNDLNLLHGSLQHSDPLLSASLSTALESLANDNTTPYFYCPYLACHHRLVFQNAQLPPTQQERGCVHTECSYVSHDLEGWLKHCNTLHHEFRREGHEECGFGCYSNEDTH